MSKKKFLAIALISTIICSCNRHANFSNIPLIKFVSLKQKGNCQGELTFYFEDGDGDIGLSGSVSPELQYDLSSYNFFRNIYEKQNGKYVLMEYPDTFTFLYARIPVLSDVVPESINGTISIIIDIKDPLSRYDTVKNSFYITDRAGNKSNVETTGEIIVVR